jgi:hypothetical protein
MLSWYAETTYLQISQKGLCSCSIEKRHQAASVRDTLQRTVVVARAYFSLEVVLTTNYKSYGVKINYKLFI